MFGSFRLLLACAVIVFHMGIRARGIFPGIVAVICFLMISGYSMAGLIEKSFRGPGGARRFYRDRALRLLPQYWLYAALSAATVYGLGWRFGESQEGPMTPLALLANVTLLPLGGYMFSAEIGHAMLLPQAWTLSLESVFYALLPWLLLSRPAMFAAVALGGTTFLFASLGVIDGDIWGYRLMPAPLIWFLGGVALQRCDWTLYGAISSGSLLSLMAIIASGRFWFGFNAAILVGAGVGLALLPVLARLPRNRIDDVLGNISYGTYVSHYIFVSALADFQTQTWAVLVAVIGSCLFGWISWALVEVPVARWRRYLRGGGGQPQERGFTTAR